MHRQSDPGSWLAAGLEARHSRSLRTPLEPSHGQHQQSMLDDFVLGCRIGAFPTQLHVFILSCAKLLFFNRINPRNTPFEVAT
jgi:hypothetical protein